MKTQKLPTLHVFQSFSHKCKNLSLQFCPKEFMRLLCEWIVNLLKRNPQSPKNHHVKNFQNNVRLFCLIKISKMGNKMGRSGIWKRSTTHKSPSSFSQYSNFLDIERTVCPRSWFCVQQQIIEYSKIPKKSFQSIKLYKILRNKVFR